MRIGLFTPYKIIIGGGERYLLTIADLLSKKHSVEFLAPHKTNKKELKFYFNLDLSSVEFKDYDGIKASYLPNLNKKYDLFFCLSNHTLPPLFALGKKSYLIVQFPFKYKINKFQHLIQFLLKSIKLNSYDSIICYSDYVRKWILNEIVDKNVLVIPPAVDINYFRPGLKRNVVLSVGRFFIDDHEKRQKDLVNAILPVIKKVNWKFCLLGSKSDTYNINGLNKNTNLIIKFNLSINELRKYYSISKIFCHFTGFQNNERLSPQKSEHFGTVVIEAMASGCVPIVVNRGALSEIIRHNYNGFLFESINEIQSYIKLLTSNDKLWQKMSHQAIFDAQKYHNISNFKQKIFSLLTHK